MKLLIEKNEFNSMSILTESTDKEKTYFIEGVFLQADIKNINERVYPKSIMLKEVNRYIKEKIERNRATGELGHPDSPSINLDRLSHKIISLKEDGSNFIGRAKVLDTPYGRIVKNLIDEGVEFGVSSRGLGSLRESNGSKIVCEDYHLVTPADIVSDPSGPECWANGLMENKEWAWENGKLIERVEMVKDTINKAYRAKVDEKMLVEMFQKLLNLV
jgi:hypothetical protein